MAKFESSETASVTLASEERLAYSPAEAARRLGVGRTFVYELLNSKKLKSARIGSRRLITPEAIRECLLAHEVK
jgi:excisionase family DNA binding protein